MFQPNTPTSILELVLTAFLVVCFAETDINRYKKGFNFNKLKFIYLPFFQQMAKDAPKMFLKTLKIDQGRHVNIYFN